MDEEKIAELLALFDDCFPYLESGRGSIPSLAKNNIVHKCIADGELAGAAIVGGGNIYLLAVAPKYRHRGIGTELLAEAEKTCRNAGCDRVTVGVGKNGYITPGIPTSVMPYAEELCPPDLYEGLTDEGAAFFRHHGYTHSRESNAFDMRAVLPHPKNDPYPLGYSRAGVTYRLAGPADRESLLRCTDDAAPYFTEYYTNEEMYRHGSIVCAVSETDGEVLGCLIADRARGGLGSIGCVAVANRARGRGVASDMVRCATRYITDQGSVRGFLSYTYTGLDKLYGKAGFRISVYYMMAAKVLR